MDAAHGCRNSFMRRLFLPITLSWKGRICRKYISSRRIKRGNRPLHLIKPTDDGRNEPGKRKERDRVVEKRDCKR
ncbi:hypothetical protein [Bacteroides thetaiotaomicron]|uniref:hypothetical protein n=1 Tax=Bacteroides thetaiotaomicron TaxID=818 RepID=UPI0036F38F4B